MEICEIQIFHSLSNNKLLSVQYKHALHNLKLLY